MRFLVICVYFIYYLTSILINGQACYIGGLYDYDYACNTNLMLTNWERSVEYVPESGYINDFALPYGWYRLMNEGDRIDVTMPTSRPGTYHCGTKYPIWIDGVYPDISDGFQNIKACVDVGFDSCYFEQSICIKACNSPEGIYYVHLLYGAPGSDMAYCTDSRLPCQNGTTSATGFEPCGYYYPILNGKPIVDFQAEDTGIATVCNYTNENIDEEMDFLVTWYINDEFVYEEEVDENFDNTVSAFISDEHDCGDGEPNQCILNEKLNSEIHCEVRARFRNTSYVEFPPGVKSNTIYAGLIIQPNNTVIISESDEGQDITITSTFPIVLRENTQGQAKIDIHILFNDDDVLVRECMQSVTNDAPAVYNVFAERDDINDGDKFPYIQFIGDRTSFSIEASRIWRRQENLIQPLTVIVQDVPSDTLCEITGDPHITTFDNWYYHLYEPGDYLLYKHNYLPIQVQVRVVPCCDSRGTNCAVACTCGVAVQIGNTYHYMVRCNDNQVDNNNHIIYMKTATGEFIPAVQTSDTRVKLATYDDGEKIPSSDIKPISRTYTITLPTGSIVTASLYQSTYFHVSLTASSDDSGNVEGLCGNFDTIDENDVYYKYGSINYDCHPECDKFEYGAIATEEFSEIWRVDNSKNLFLGNLDYGDRYERVSHCTCDENGIESCRYCNGRFDGGSFECDEFINGIVKRSVEDETDDLVGDFEFEPLVYDTNFEKTVPEFPTPSGLTEEYTRRLCNETLVNSTTYSLCLNTINNGSVVIDDIIEGCVVDVKVFDDVSIAKDTILILQERCKVVLTKNPFYWEKTENGTLAPPTDILDKICVNECNGMGECINGTCECNDGLGGSDCSISLVEPPLVFAVLGDGICDVRERPCKSAKVFGKNFLEEINITCHLQHIGVNENGIVVLTKEHVLPGIFRTPEEVKCPLPELTVQPDAPGEGTVASGYLIAISNDGELISESMAAMFLYDSVCQACNASAGRCTLKDNSCNINGHCYAALETNPVDGCEHCLPEESVDKWSRKQDSEDSVCKDEVSQPQSYTTLIICSVAGVVVFLLILIGLVVIWKRCTSRSKADSKNPIVVYSKETTSGVDNLQGHIYCSSIVTENGNHIE